MFFARSVLRRVLSRDAGTGAPTGRNPDDRVLLHTPPGMKVQFRGGARLGRTPPCRAARWQGNADLWPVLPVGAGTARRRRAAGKDPEFGSGSPLGRDPGVQRHPDGWVVHAFRCASRSGADQRSAFPCQRRHLDCWGSRRGCIFTATGQHRPAKRSETADRRLRRSAGTARERRPPVGTAARSAADGVDAEWRQGAGVGNDSIRRSGVPPDTRAANGVRCHCFRSFTASTSTVGRAAAVRFGGSWRGLIEAEPPSRTARRFAPGFRSAARAARRPRSRRGWGRGTRLPAAPGSGIPTVQMVPAARERRPLGSSPGGARHARERETCTDDAGPCRCACRTTFFHAAGVYGGTRSWGFLPVGAGTAARSAADGVDGVDGVDAVWRQGVWLGHDSIGRCGV